MALYSYSAIDLENVIRDGVMEGVDRQMVAKQLMLQGMRPLDIHPHVESSVGLFSSLGKFRQNKITRTDIEFFTKQIALLLDAGLSLDGALRVMRQHSGKQAFRELTGHIERKLKEGKSFSQALADQPEFSAMYVNIAKAGEEGGILPAMLTKMSEYQSVFQELKQYVVSASIYPLFLLAVGMVAMILLVVVILPRFEVLFQGIGRQLPLNVRIMMDVAKIVSAHPFLSLAALSGPPACLISYFRSDKGKRAYDRLVLRLPLFSGIVRDLETTKIFRTLQVLVENGVHMATALKISSGVASNREFQRLLHQATAALKEGRRVGKKLKSEGVLPELAADLLSIGEESGEVAQVCGQIADYFENELRTRIKRIIAMVEPFFILVIALVAGYVVISMLSVILSINEIAG